MAPKLAYRRGKREGGEEPMSKHQIRSGDGKWTEQRGVGRLNPRRETKIQVMQVGFAMLEVGSISPKNTKAVLIKNIIDAALGAICWWTVGHGFAYGKDAGGFIGTSDFAFANSDLQFQEEGINFAKWFFHWAFAATAATVVSGAVAERVKMIAYLQLSFFVTFFIYPAVVHWAWSEGGWASPFRCRRFTTTEDYRQCLEQGRALLLGCGAVDFAGSGVVHMTGGITALIAAAVIQPRTGKFRSDGTINRMPQQSPALQTLGALILWVGSYGFSGGSVGAVSDGRSALVAAAMVNNTIATAASVLSMGLLMRTLHKKFDSGHLNNGIISGLVSINASGPMVRPEGAFIIGSLASAVYMLGVKGLKRLKIDDVVQASAVHFGCGMWGVISAGLFITKERYRNMYSDGVYADPDRDDRCCGVFYGCSGRLLGANLVLMITMGVWVAGLSYLALMGIKATVGLRVPINVEERGMDRSRHGRNAKTSGALRRALRATGADRSTPSSQRPSLKPSRTGSPRPAAPILPHWKE
ncbi:unnamed protein product [Ascophyllum nodosum]